MTIENAPSCPSNLMLDRYLVDELDGDQKRTLREHIEACTRCRVRLEELSAFQASFAEPSPFAELPSAPPARESNAFPRWPRSRSTRLVASGALVSAMAAMAAMAMLSLRAPSAPEEVRTKGSIGLSYHVSRAGAVWLAGPDESLRENDQIQFLFTAPSPGFLAVLSVDGRNVVSVYYPSAGHVAADYRPEAPRLSSSTVLDDVPGREVFLAVFCDEPFATEDAARALREHGGEPDTFRFGDCQVAALAARKESP